MAKDPAFLFYPNDYIGGTMGWTFEEKGAFIELLMLQFNRGHMTKHMIGQTVGQLWDNIKDKFEEDDEGKFFNKRLEEEQFKRKKYTDSRRNNKSGKNQHSKKEKKEGHMTSHMENEDVNENEDVIKDESQIKVWPSFDDFWEAYDKKTDSKTKVEKKWNSLSQKTKESIMDHLPDYVASTPDKNFRKNPSTYLNNEGWTHEIINKHEQGFTETLATHLAANDPDWKNY